MNKAQITKRISQFERVVDHHAKKIIEVGNASWDPINKEKDKNETQTVRAFLIQKMAGVDYLNRNLAKLLSKNGRVVKFAGLFLHGTPLVNGWIKNAKSGAKKKIGECELADLMTVFLYLDSGNTIRRMRCVMFQAKMEASTGTHVIGEEDLKQRRLYDDCEGFDYCHGTVAKAGEERRLPIGASRKKALQFAFVGPRPVETRTIPSAKGKGETLEYGQHLVRFLNGKTGLNQRKGKDDWSLITTELMEKMATGVYTDGKIKGPGIQDVLNHFNNFESPDIWCIDASRGDDDLGVQLVIVWDGDIPSAQPQEIMPPTIPAKKGKISVRGQKRKLQQVSVEEEIPEEAEVNEVVRDYR